MILAKPQSGNPAVASMASITSPGQRRCLNSSSKSHIIARLTASSCSGVSGGRCQWPFESLQAPSILPFAHQRLSVRAVTLHFWILSADIFDLFWNLGPLCREMKADKSRSRPKRRVAYQLPPRQGGGILLTAKELAQKLGEREKTIFTWYRSGLIPGYDLGWRIRRFRLEAVLKALEKRKVRS